MPFPETSWFLMETHKEDVRMRLWLIYTGV